MAEASQSLISLEGWAAAQWYVDFYRDPLLSQIRVHAKYGSFIRVPIPRLSRRKQRKDLLMIAGAKPGSQVLVNPEVWRTVGIAPWGPVGSAAKRLGRGLIMLQGREHAYYRRLVVPPLHRRNIDGGGADMAQLAAEVVDRWPVGGTVDLWAESKMLVHTLALGVLFGGKSAPGYAVAGLIDDFFNYIYSLKEALTRWNGPYTAHRRMLETAERLEGQIVAWADSKRGGLNKGDLLSIIVNSPNQDGHPASNEQIAGHVPTLFGAAFHTCQTALIWTLVLLDQHPLIARDLYDELRERLAGATPSVDRIADLPLLDAVVKEGMRILPPVPLQYRVAVRDTTLLGHPVRAERNRVLLSSFLTNRQPDLYPEPDRFRPERWFGADPLPYEFASFSDGPRKCPGQWFGVVAIKIAVATIVARYRPAIVAGTRIDHKLRVTLSPRKAVPAVLHRQDGAFTAAPLRGSIRNLLQLPH